MKHAASVRPEPGSNSPLSESYVLTVVTVFDSCLNLLRSFRYHFCELTLLFRLQLFYCQGSANLFFFLQHKL